MKSNYKKLGPYIRELSVKNKSLSVELLLGVSITKRFIPSIANTVGADMSKYKIVKRHQFAYGPVTSRNGEKISVALLNVDTCLVSTSYTVFEIVDTEDLDPEYLMMWFRRSEFDRYARYMSHGTVRELFGWQEMCDVELPIPSIEEQREIVREYNVVNDRISLNEQLTQKLEETAQAIYKQWFVDFEFPISKEYAESINKPELQGKPYKSSGGEIEYNEYLEVDIPSIWKGELLSELFDITIGRTPPRDETHWFTCESSGYKWLSIKDIVNNGTYAYQTNEKLTREAVKKFKVPLIPEGTTVMSFKMTVGKLCITTENMLSNEAIAHFKLLDNSNLSSELIYCFLKQFKFEEMGSTSSIVASINSKMIKNIRMLVPDGATSILFKNKVGQVFDICKFFNKEKIILEDMSSVLLNNISRA